MGAQPEIVYLPTRDHFPTRGHLYTPQSNKISAPVALIAAATGVPGRYYGPLASWLSSYHEVPVLIVDYRYCGLSFPRNVNPKDPKERKAAIIAARDVLISKDWAEDIRAGLKFIRERFPGRGVSYLGNSAGGWLLPLAKSIEDNILRALFISVNCPFYGYYTPPNEKLKTVEDALKLTDHLGHFPCAKMGLGEDIPASCGVEWMSWMYNPRYMASSFPAQFDAFSHVPILSLIFNDDIVAHTPHTHAADKTLQTMPQIDSVRIVLDPIERGWGPVGHVGMFKEEFQGKFWEGFALWLKDGDIWEHFQGDRREHMGTRVGKM